MSSINKINNKIGCNSSGLNIVDPNAFDGINSSSNISVATEDLNLSVVLRTSRKGRSVLTNNDGVGSVENTQNIAINFMDGSLINGEKVLTTKYTELTTVFDKGVINDETLGITNIDIDFNSSMTPMITINFVDVRGSSIFQNEEGIAGGSTSNKYSTFFQLPYPIFELEIKGYYGKPVTYCLHMLKFSSKFNSKTGNFEIQCEFIGYTYAMLSDMLIGFLKAIPYTKIGANLYDKYRANKNSELITKNPAKILTLNELMTQISEINSGVTKIAGTSTNSSAINSVKEGLSQLGNIENVINMLGDDLQYSHTLDNPIIPKNYNYIIKTSKELSSPEIDSIKRYQDEVKKTIDIFNGYDINGLKLDASIFQSITIVGKNKGYYTKLSKDLLDPNNTESNSSIGELVGSGEVVDFKKNLLNYLITNYPDIRNNFLIDVYDMNSLFKLVSETRKKLEEYNVFLTKELAGELKNNAKEKLGFEPTVRNIIEIFTASIEVLMEAIYTVSKTAESNTKRRDELKNVFSVKHSTDSKTDNLEANNFFAWPDYREKDQKNNTFTEKYLGSEGVLTNKSNVDELTFIDELLDAFIKSGKQTDLIQNQIEADETTWYPINPLDSKVFNETEPYKRTELHNYLDVIRLSLIRGMTFMGYSNDETILSDDDIVNMGKIEGEAILRSVIDTKVKKSLINITLDNIINSKGIINNINENVVIKSGNEYVYNYIYGNQADGVKSVIIPITDTFEGTWPVNKEGLITKANDETNKSLFLTNYSQDLNYAGKRDDGCDYVKILQPNDIEIQGNLVTTSSSVKNETTLILNKLTESKVTSSAGFNPIGGPIGVADFKKMSYGANTGLPLMYIFYRDYDNGLALSREKSGKGVSDSDLKSSGNIYTVPIRSAYKSTNDEYLHKSLGKNRSLFNDVVSSKDTTITYPYIEQRFIDSDSTGDIREAYSDNSFSLFGSQWYYNQDKAVCTGYYNENGFSKNAISCEQYAKATLFLNTLPFNIKHDYFLHINQADPFGLDEIINLFNKQAGFIHAPRLWCAFIGSILWWLNDGEGVKYPIFEGGVIVGGGSGRLNPFNWDLKTNTFTGVVTKILPPTRGEYFPPVLNVIGVTWQEFYPKVFNSHMILRMPQQVKDEFKKCFFDFVNGTDDKISWESIRNSFEIWNGTSREYASFMDNSFSQIKTKGAKRFFDSNILNNPKLKNKGNYQIMTFDNHLYVKSSHYLFLESKDGSNAVNKIIQALTQEVIIVNNNYKIWTKESSSTNYSNIKVSKTNFDKYFNSLISVFKENKVNEDTENKKVEQDLFGTTNNDVIKLMLYRTCKNIHDKWLAGVTNNEQIMYQCGGASSDNGRSIVDTNIGKEYGNKTPKFIDTFRFVSRSFKDIGDDLYINPIPVNDYLINGLNSGAYDAISSLLASNNFNFIALPNFINYRDKDEIEAIFKPHEVYEQAKLGGSCGPAFVCVYAGEGSKHLDMKNSEYPNDGFDLRCTDGSVDVQNIPDDFTQDLKDFEDGLGVFTVKYSQQNQNIFKDIELDQNEFTETNESLQIQEAISQKGNETNRTIAGQNMFNVYSVRSYTATVEMMGNAMIQPMMYFQLDNIPMFHGGYLITRVKHKIVPNNMVTTFSGVRTKYTATPLITAYDFYMSMVESIDTTSAGTGPVNLPKSVPPIIEKIIENGGMPSNIIQGNIKMSALGKVSGINNAVPKSNNLLLSEAIAPLTEMLNEWVKWMKSVGFSGSKDNKEIFANITSMYRTNEDQIRIRKEYPKSASAGVSNHQWGIALDFQFYKKNGDLIPNKPNVKTSFNVGESYNYALKWLLDNSYKYGWYLPYGLRNGVGSIEEHWHFEYHGTSAKCLMEKYPTTYGYTVTNFIEQKVVVTNPKTSKGETDVYTDCDYVVVKNVGDGVDIELGGGADYWSLVSICALEAGFPQARADVAQSIYNRLATPNKPYGKTLKEIIIAKGAYEPTFKNVGQWKSISNKSSALTAIMGAKGWNKTVSEKHLNETIEAISNVTLQNNSRGFIGTRTEFLSRPPTSSKAESVVQRSPDVQNNAFFWRYAGKALINKTPPNAPDFTKLV